VALLLYHGLLVLLGLLRLYYYRRCDRHRALDEVRFKTTERNAKKNGYYLLRTATNFYCYRLTSLLHFATTAAAAATAAATAIEYALAAAIAKTPFLAHARVGTSSAPSSFRAMGKLSCKKPYSSPSAPQLLVFHSHGHDPDDGPNENASKVWV